MHIDAHKSVPHLTKYTPGSMRELWSISLPLMMTFLSGQLMLFGDRLILAHYSIEAMSAAAAVGTLCAVFQYGGLAITSIAEVFVGQYNGAGQPYKVAIPVWQMIWFSAFLFLIFIPLAFFGGSYFIPEALFQEGNIYYKWLMVFGPVQSFLGAITAFYVGRGKVHLVTIAAIIANVVNIGLDYILVFGIPQYIPSLGIEGAAIATVFSEVIECLILLIIFLKPKYQKRYGTHRWKFDQEIFLACLKIGTPNAVGRVIEISAWSFLFHIMSWVSGAHMMVLAVGQSVFLLFCFLLDGITKGITALASNFIGAQKWEFIPKTLLSAIKIHFIIIMLSAIPLFFFSDLLVDQFLKNIDPMILPVLQEGSRDSLRWLWLFMVFDGLVWIVAGILTAAGDTKFIMISNAILVWTCAIFPLYILVKNFDIPLYVSWMVTTFYGFMNALLFIWRYRSQRWRKLQLQ
jgi:MATE family multidrug resistance protein